MKPSLKTLKSNLKKARTEFNKLSSENFIDFMNWSWSTQEFQYKNENFPMLITPIHNKIKTLEEQINLLEPREESDFFLDF